MADEFKPTLKKEHLLGVEILNWAFEICKAQPNSFDIVVKDIIDGIKENFDIKG